MLELNSYLCASDLMRMGKKNHKYFFFFAKHMHACFVQITKNKNVKENGCVKGLCSADY